MIGPVLIITKVFAMDVYTIANTNVPVLIPENNPINKPPFPMLLN